MWAITAFFVLLSAVAINFVCARLHLFGRSLLRIMTIAGIGLALLFFVLWDNYSTGIETVAGLAIYGFSCELYVFLFTLPLSSVSINMMNRLKSRCLSGQQLDAIYDNTHMVQMRIDRLLEAELLKSNDGLLEATSLGKNVDRSFGWIKRVFRNF